MILLWSLAIAAPPIADGPMHVVGGAPADPGAWPDAAALLDAGGRFLCTGVLVAPDLVLTAGHCDLGIAQVVLDTVDYETPGEVVGVAGTVAHPDLWTTFDVTAVVLDRPALTAPRPILRGCLTDWLVPGAEVAIVGYGATDPWGSTFGTVLQEAWTTVVDPECADEARGCNGLVLPGGEVLAGGDGVDSCNGDSGGPLYIPTPEGTFLAGVTSRAAVPQDAPCGDGGIYVRPDAILDWLAEETGVTFDDPTCTVVRNAAPEVSVAPLFARSGIAARVDLIVDDPEGGDTITVRLSAAPAHGDLAQDATGQWVYRSDPGFVGADAAAFHITDAGEPTHELTVDLAIDVTAAPAMEPPRACATPGATGALTWWVVPLLVCRRRVAHRRGSPRRAG